MTALSVQIDQDLCVASGFCVRRLPDLFVETPEGVAALRSGAHETAGPVDVPDEYVVEVDQAEVECPAGAILLSGGDR